jgi:hypothetical protein
LFLSTVKAKGNQYIYLCGYSRERKFGHYSKNVETLFRFGRKELAILNMRSWRKDFNSFPVELKNIGCGRADLEDWIKTLETGITKTGKKFKAII